MEESGFEAAGDPQPTDNARPQASGATTSIDVDEAGLDPAPPDSDAAGEDGSGRPVAKKRRRGSRGGKGRKKPAGAPSNGDDTDGDDDDSDDDDDDDVDSDEDDDDGESGAERDEPVER